jgi:DNA-binding HxlR family transcriptional regulator
MINHSTTFCPAHRAIGVLQEKWVLHIVRALLSGNRGFNELSRTVGGCNSATLTQRLEQLEGLGIIAKATDAEVTGKLARSIYSLTVSGRELQTVIDAIDAWGRRHLPEDPAARPDIDDCAGTPALASVLQSVPS